MPIGKSLPTFRNALRRTLPIRKCLFQAQSGQSSRFQWIPRFGHLFASIQARLDIQETHPMRMKTVVLALSLSLIGFTPKFSFADTLQLETATGNTSGPDIFPYGFSVDGSTSLTSLSCLNYNREITFGEEWNVTVTGLSSLSTTAIIDGSSDTALREDAFLDYYYNHATVPGIGAVTNSEIQYAIWDILDPSDINGLTGLYDSTSQNLVKAAQGAAAGETNAFLSQFTLFTPTTDQTGWTAGTPQQFLEFTPGTGNDAPPAVTPEPSSLALLGTGFLGMVAIMRRRIAVPVKG